MREQDVSKEDNEQNHGSSVTLDRHQWQPAKGAAHITWLSKHLAKLVSNNTTINLRIQVNWLLKLIVLADSESTFEEKLFGGAQVLVQHAGVQGCLTEIVMSV